MGRGKRSDVLSQAEKLVLTGLWNGLTIKEIANEMSLAASTIKSYAQSIYRKLDAPGQVPAIRRGLELGLLKVHVEPHGGDTGY